MVDSSKDLQPDPNTLLLSHIATLIANGANSTVATIPPQIQISPSLSSSRINALWFTSLVLSLATVLIGIVSLQWIREHQQYSGLSSEEKFSIFCMRKEALEAWYVPHIFAGLPLLLQGALALYLAGLIDHLLGFGPGVAIPGIVFIALSLLFLIATTVLPTLQGLVVLPTHLEITLDLPSPCPYKSPQSFAFRRLATTFQRGFLATSWIMGNMKWMFVHLPKKLYRFILPGAIQLRFVKTSQQLFPSILTVWRNTSWIDFDRSWLSFHDCMFLNITEGRLLNEYYRPTKPLYNAVKGIRLIARGNQMNTPERYLFAQFHCLQDISPPIVTRSDSITSPQRYRNTYFQLLLIVESSNDLNHDLNRNSPFLSQKLAKNFDVHFTSQENTLAILDIIDPSHKISPALSRHFAECNLQLLVAVCSKICQLYWGSGSRELAISSFSLSSAIHNIKKSGNETGAGLDMLYYTVLNQGHSFMVFQNLYTNGPCPSALSFQPSSIQVPTALS